MTLTQKNELINQIALMLDKLIDVDDKNPRTPVEQPVAKPMEMLTIKECVALVDGLSEHTVRQLVAQDKGCSCQGGRRS